ncbi:hypothetical protein OCGS_2096 [Oceaniovalibus guishaninsula JLT2003]|uniref:Uncharacterized protein n=1 Tax=Oceaniovalibus guishaninsula JLT2003 TaxID=1231392 RepID=K2HAR4_9RHOB|nr:hypothetical protein [Oceaniovalibus guishaninsula]EKE43762.1 hypothetical protein OCGS_2096 [Oceaniovalibus guishaninsula JLT2003]
MAMMADILLIAGALGVAFYCFVLSRRLTRFTDLERGVGGAVAVLSAQVDDLTRTLEKARQAGESSSAALQEVTERAAEVTQRAEDASRRLELHLAALHDLPPRTEPPARPDAAAPSTDPSEQEEVEAPLVFSHPVRAATPPVQSFFAAMSGLAGAPA